jgi:proteasome lid subunit RPN8/RPN11
VISIGRELVDRMISEFAACGAAQRECVVYWLAPLSQSDQVSKVVHPLHTASAFGYQVDDAWLTEFFFDLADDRHTAVAQIHTHPGGWLDHSNTDDTFVLIPSPGFVSIVVPNFAQGFERGRCAIHVLEASGEWRIDPGVVRW